MSHSLWPLAGIVWLLAAGPAPAQEAVVTAAEVEVRSYPGSLPAYVTGKLRRGDRVQVLGTQAGYVQIAPPPGSFSLIAKESVLLNPGAANTATVRVEGAETLVGGSATNDVSIRGAKLPQGYIVTVLGEVTLTTPQGPVAYYKIAPEKEVRYVPADAVQPLNSAGTSASTPPAAPAAPPLAEPVKAAPAGAQEPVALMRMADEAYRQAESTGNWGEAKRLYEELARSPSHEARMLAWNRLEFIRQRAQAAPAPAAPPPSAARAAPPATPGRPPAGAPTRPAGR